MDDVNVRAGKMEGAVPKRATQCSFLICINFFIKIRGKTWTRIV